MLLLASRRRTVGLDIGAFSVKAVHLRRRRGGWSLRWARSLPRTAGSAPGGGAAGAIAQLVRAVRCRGAATAAALPAGAAVVARATLPPMTPQEQSEALRWEATHHIPFDPDDAHVDCHASGGREGGAADVLIAAARRQDVEERAALVREAGLRPAVLDVPAFALVNAYLANYPERVDPLTVLVDVGHSAATVCVLRRGQLAQVREAAADHALDEASRAIDRAHDSADAPPIVVVLSGGGSEAAGVRQAFAGAFGASVEVMNPFRRLVGPGGPPDCGPSYAVAVGLAMRRRGDR